MMPAPKLPRKVGASELAGLLKAVRSGNGWKARCPAHDDRVPSLSISEGADGRCLVHCHGNCTQEQVLNALASKYGVQPAGPERGFRREAQGTAKEEWEPITPIPSTAPKAPPHPSYGKPSKRWAYRDKGGNVLFLVYRWDNPDGSKKAILSLTYGKNAQGRQEWRWRALPPPRPLYGLDQLAARPDAPVVVCEGEKAADAAGKLLPDHVATTSPNGAEAASKADWTPVGRRAVAIWPDADNPGQKYAADVARLCWEAGATEVRVITPPEGVSEGWDAADALREGWGTEHAKALVAKAHKPADDTPSGEISLPALSVGELMALDLPERARLLPFLPEGGLTMIFGPRGIGKTYFALGLAISLAMGTGFLKWGVLKPVGTLIVDGEMALTDVRDRLQFMLPGKPLAPLEILSHEYVYAKCGRELDLGREDWQELLKAYLEERPEIRVLILDNLSCLLPGVAEDKRDDWAAKVLPFIIWLRRRGIAAVFVHHAGKGGEQRGTSAREDNLDTVIRLGHVPDHDATHGAQFVVRFAKARGVFGDDVAEIEVWLETDADGMPKWTWKPVEESNEKRLLNLVRDGIDSVSEAAEELNVAKGTVSKLKKKLQGKGLLKPGKRLELADG